MLVLLLRTPQTVARQAPLSKGFSRQEYWSGLPFPAAGDLPDPGLSSHFLRLLHWQVDSLPLHHHCGSYNNVMSIQGNVS